MDKLQAERLCRVLVEKCIGIRPGEVSLIVTSPAQSSQVSKELFRSLTARGSRAMMLFVPEVLLTEDRLPSAVATSMKQAQVTIIYTQRMFPVSSRNAALQSGARILSLSGMTDPMLLRAADTDYDEVERVVLDVAAAMGEADTITVESAAGTRLEVAVDKVAPHAFTGVSRHSGDWTELPAGGVNAAVKRGSAKGRIVVNGTVSEQGLVKTPFTLTLEDGRITAIDGGDEAAQFRALLHKGDENAAMVSEIGVGLNPTISLMGNLREDQRARGAVLIGFGRNSHVGGSVHSNLQTSCVISGAVARIGHLTVGP